MAKEINLVLGFVHKLRYSKGPNKRSATFINHRKIFQGLRSYWEGVRLLVLIKYFLQDSTVGTKVIRIEK